eukprot:2951521-Lingulodinium_polyedra.AAC.1
MPMSSALRRKSGITLAASGRVVSCIVSRGVRRLGVGVVFLRAFANTKPVSLALPVAVPRAARAP